ncbi:MAG: prolyl aminopeptidase [bacterium]|nr:MAG: prolyl aminopeptidase [bacterium]
MKRHVYILIAFIAAVASMPYGCTGTEETQLWPEIEPFETGHLKVSKIHEIYYELCGNPEGTPVFALHGGPGGSSSPYMRRFFNPEAFLIVLHDQRGCGKSTPYAEIRENTTRHLVEDIELLRKHLKCGTIILFGGSWGSTLALAYAETYPEHVHGMVLRGIFTATSDEIDHFYHGGVRIFFPDVYEEFRKALPDPETTSIPKHLLTLIQNGNEDEKQKYSRLWAEYEIKVSGLNVPDRVVDGILRDSNPLAFGLLENYYMANGCFFEEEQLLREAGSIGDTRVILVNGRYDMICPPVNAYRLHQRLSNSKLVIAEGAGHWMGERPVERALLEAMSEFEMEPDQ